MPTYFCFFGTCETDIIQGHDAVYGLFFIHTEYSHNNNNTTRDGDIDVWRLPYLH